MEMDSVNSKTLPARSEVDQKYKWKLEDIYSSDDMWENDFKEIKKLLPEISGFKEKLKESPVTFLECLKLRDKIVCLAEKLYTYARMKRDEDNSNSKYQALADRAVGILTEVSAAVSFIEPEIISIDEELLKSFLEENAELKIYSHYINDILREKKHILSQREEELLAFVSEIAEASSEIFSMLNNADIKFPTIKDEKGEEVELTKGRYIRFLESNDRRVRKDAYEKLYEVYKGFRNTFASSLSNNIRQERFFAKVRRYNSTLEASLSGDNVSTDVYDNLIKAVHDNLYLFYRYMDLRKNILKLDKLQMYDIYVPLVTEPMSNIPYEEACTIVEKAFEPLGEEYVGYVREAFKSGWVDVYENKGKTSGAYSWGNYVSHPYILLNYQGTIGDVFTLAHEMGHAMHTFYTNKTQPFIYSEYKIFVAEVASILNEFLLMDYMIFNSQSKEEKAYYINHYLDEFRGTLFRQTMFAEFEKIIHGKASEGEALTAETLSDIYNNLNLQYYGVNVESDDNIAFEWARIPHFYTSFYVYKYATSFAAAASLSGKILNREPGAIERYIEFLSSGGSDYPIELLKKAGVDLTTPKPIEDAMKKYESLLNELEELIL
jgi:oligoendopeptidase F